MLSSSLPSTALSRNAKSVARITLHATNSPTQTSSLARQLNPSKIPQPRITPAQATLAATTMRIATLQERMISSTATYSHAALPRYAVSITQSGCQGGAQHTKTTLFNQKIRQSPFRKGLDKIVELGLTKDLKASSDRVKTLSQTLANHIGSLSSAEARTEQLQLLEYQLLGPQSEIGSKRTTIPGCIDQLHYDCYKLLSERGMTFADLKDIVLAIQTVRQTLINSSIHNCAVAASVAPWPESPKSHSLSFSDFMTRSQST